MFEFANKDARKVCGISSKLGMKDGRAKQLRHKKNCEFFFQFAIKSQEETVNSVENHL